MLESPDALPLLQEGVALLDYTHTLGHTTLVLHVIHPYTLCNCTVLMFVYTFGVSMKYWELSVPWDEVAATMRSKTRLSFTGSIP